MGEPDASRRPKQQGRAHPLNKPCLFVRVCHLFLRTSDSTPDQRKVPPRLMCVGYPALRLGRTHEQEMQSEHDTSSRALRGTALLHQRWFTVAP